MHYRDFPAHQYDPHQVPFDYGPDAYDPERPFTSEEDWWTAKRYLEKLRARQTPVRRAFDPRLRSLAEISRLATMRALKPKPSRVHDILASPSAAAVLAEFLDANPLSAYVRLSSLTRSSRRHLLANEAPAAAVMKVTPTTALGQAFTRWWHVQDPSAMAVGCAADKLQLTPWIHVWRRWTVLARPGREKDFLSMRLKLTTELWALVQPSDNRRVMLKLIRGKPVREGIFYAIAQVLSPAGARPTKSEIFRPGQGVSLSILKSKRSSRKHLYVFDGRHHFVVIECAQMGSVLPLVLKV